MNDVFCSLFLQFSKVDGSIYCVSKKSCPILIVYSLHKNGQNFLDIRNLWTFCSTLCAQSFLFSG